MPRVRQHRTSKAQAIQQRSKQKHINNFEKETVLDDLHREGIYMNVHNIHIGHTRYLWKDNTTLWKFTYKKLCDRYVNHYVNYSSYAVTYDCSNIRCYYGIIVGFEFEGEDNPIIIDDEIFHNPDDPNGPGFYNFPICGDISTTTHEIRMVIHDIFNPKLRLGSIPYKKINHYMLPHCSITKEVIDDIIAHYYNVMLKNKLEPPKNFEITECGICLDTMDEKSILLPCGHKFHKECIDEWKKESLFCPYCKTIMDGLSFNSLWPKIVGDMNKSGCYGAHYKRTRLFEKKKSRKHR
jgi:hypothetical protein